MTIEQKLQRLNEKNLRKEIIIPLMKAFGGLDVRDVHGKDEGGLDVLYKNKNIFEELVYEGILLKACTINKATLTSSVKTQIEEAAGGSRPDLNNPGDTTRIRGLMLITNNNITSGAIKHIDIFAGKNFPRIEYMDGKKLSNIIDKIIHRYNEMQSTKQNPKSYNFGITTFRKFCEDYRKVFPKPDTNYVIIRDKIRKTSEGKEVSQSVS